MPEYTPKAVVQVRRSGLRILLMMSYQQRVTWCDLRLTVDKLSKIESASHQHVQILEITPFDWLKRQVSGLGSISIRRQTQNNLELKITCVF